MYSFRPGCILERTCFILPIIWLLLLLTNSLILLPSSQNVNNWETQTERVRLELPKYKGGRKELWELVSWPALYDHLIFSPSLSQLCAWRPLLPVLLFIFPPFTLVEKPSWLSAILPRLNKNSRIGFKLEHQFLEMKEQDGFDGARCCQLVYDID